tara:strand:- start:199 stop:816 length:618 start_codon:yes stop_codon:yes gene_type:complete
MSIDIKLHLGDLPAEIDFKNCDRIALDAEFNGLNINRDRLCMVQISSGNNDAHLIQFKKNDYKSPNLKKVLSNKSINKIFHFARSDLAFINRYLNVEVENVECTKLMSKIGRSYTDKHGLKDLIKEFIGIDINKQLQSSDFGGKLTDKQLLYCANDVVYLHKIYEELNKILIREKRIELYNETVKFISTRVKLDLAEFKEDVWSH